MRQVGSMKLGTVTVAVTVVDDEGRYWWYHKSEAFPERRYLRNGPFKSREEAEEHHITGPCCPPQVVLAFRGGSGEPVRQGASPQAGQRREVTRNGDTEVHIAQTR